MPQLHSEGSNLYELMLDVRKNLSETTAAFWTDLEVYRQLNKGQQHIVKKSKCLKRTATITTTASTQEYDLHSTTNGFSNIIDISEDGVYFKINGTSYQPLDFTTKGRLNKKNPGWQGVAASVPSQYYYDKTTKTIGIYPKPNSSNAGAYLFVSGYHMPKILNAGTAASGSTSQIVLATGSATVPYPSVTNDYYNNLFIEIYGGTGAGQKVEITDYVGSSRTCTTAFTTAPDSSSTYGMVPQINEEACYLMVLYALAQLWGKGGSRTTLALNYLRQYYDGLNQFISEFIEDSDEILSRDSYR